VARSPGGPWIYASVTDYEPRAPGEPAEHALARLRHCIDRAKDKGSIVEFVQQRDWTARRGEVPLEHVRERLREGIARRRNPALNQRRYDWSAPVPNAPPGLEVDERLRRWREAQAAINVKVREAAAPARSPAAPVLPPPACDPTRPSLPDGPSILRSESQKNKSELSRRRYDWTPAPATVDPLVLASRSRSPDRGR
jgi:hypothetical protein